MALILKNNLIDQFEQMYSPTPWTYEWGAAKKGCVDCSGAFVYAYKVLGGPYIPHSSNAIARQSCGIIQPNLNNTAPPGWAALKWRKQTNETLLKKYGIDDYYHIGLIDNSGKYVLNAKGTKYGFCRDSLNKSWQYIAPLKAVNYKGENIMTVKFVAKVTTESGPLRIRTAPSNDSTQIGKIPKDALVDVYDDSNSEWWQVGYEGIVGYSSAAFLTKITDDNPSQPITPDTNTITITMNKDLALELFEQLSNALGED